MVMLQLAHLSQFPKTLLRPFGCQFSIRHTRHCTVRKARHAQQQLRSVSAMADSSQNASKRQKVEDEAAQNTDMANKMLDFINNSVTQYHAVGGFHLDH